MRIPRNAVSVDGWNFWWVVQRSLYAPIGWRRLQVGVFRIKPNTPCGAEFEVSRGFLWTIWFWWPITIGRGL